MAKRGNVGGYAVVVLDRNREIVDEYTCTDRADVGPAVRDLRTRYGGPRGPVARPQEADHGPVDLEDLGELPADDEEIDVGAGMQLVHRMMWMNFRQTAQAQAWLMGQAQSFTQQLVDGNRRLAEHANALQRHYQDRLAEIDYSLREQRLMEQEASSRRYSQHIIDKAAAEAAASRPGQGGEGWDDLIEGVAAVLECWARSHEGDRR